MSSESIPNPTTQKLNLSVSNEKEKIRDDRFFFGLSWTRPKTDGESAAVVTIIVAIAGTILLCAFLAALHLMKH